MPLLGQAAMLLLFDIEREAIPEHDHWHTYEHLPERLAIPGFLRGTRWVALRGQPGYLVTYEVERLTTLTSEPYLERLNTPSPWTSRMMPHYRGMTRGFCSVTAGFGAGIGRFSLLLRFKPAREAETSLRQWLLRAALPQLPAMPGVGGAHLLERALTPEMTTEQRIRGADAGLDWALLLTGYRQDALTGLMQDELRNARLEEHGATGVLGAMYQLAYSLTDREVAA